MMIFQGYPARKEEEVAMSLLSQKDGVASVLFSKEVVVIRQLQKMNSNAYQPSISSARIPVPLHVKIVRHTTKIYRPPRACLDSTNDSDSLILNVMTTGGLGAGYSSATEHFLRMTRPLHCTSAHFRSVLIVMSLLRPRQLPWDAVLRALGSTAAC